MWQQLASFVAREHKDGDGFIWRACASLILPLFTFSLKWCKNLCCLRLLKKKCNYIQNTAQIKTQIPLILRDYIGAVQIALFHFNNCVHSKLNKLEAQVPLATCEITKLCVINFVGKKYSYTHIETDFAKNNTNAFKITNLILCSGRTVLTWPVASF